jgi:tripartite-type tricarboxylate transporter receptor subunit TctC
MHRRPTSFRRIRSSCWSVLRQAALPIQLRAQSQSRWQAALKQPVLVENRPGAGGNIAAAAVAKSAPDGYTLLVSFSSHTINATLYPSLPYDPVADFTPITMVARVPSLLVGRANLPADDLKALIELARTKPHTLTIGIGGIGSSLHLAGEKFKR